MSSSNQKQKARLTTLTRVLCVFLAGLLILSSVAAIFGSFG